MPQSLADTYVHSYGQLRSVAARFVRREDVDDLVQEAYLRAIAHGNRFRGEAAPTTWIYRILVNACLDVRRYRQRRGVHVTLGEAHGRPRGRQWQRHGGRRHSGRGGPMTERNSPYAGRIEVRP